MLWIAGSRKMKQLNLKGKQKKIILAAAAAIMVIIVMVLAVGSLNKKLPAGSNLDLVRSGNTNIRKTRIRKQSLIAAVDTIDGNLNPVVMTASGDQAACSIIFEPLARKMPDGSYENVLAKKVKWEKDTLTLTVELKEDILFSDGSPMTADDVCASIGAYCLSAYNLDTDGPYFNIKGAWDMNEGTAQGIEGIKKIDEHTVSVTFLRASAKNWGILETPVQKNTFASIGDQFDGFTAVEKLSRNGIGTGAYLVNSVSAGYSIQLTENPYYRETIRDIRQVEFKKVNFYDMEDALDEQEVDVISFSAGSERFDMLYDASKYDIYTYTGNNIYMLGFNMNDVFLREKEVRQAIAHAIRRDEVITKDWRSYYEETDSIGYGTKEEASLSASAPSYDKGAAEKILKKLGFEGEMSFRLPVREEDEFQKTVAMAVKESLEAIGIGVEITEYSNEEYVHALYIEDAFELYLFTQSAAYDWESLSAFGSARNGMPVACTDLEYIEAVDAISGAEDSAAYQKALSTAAEKFYECMPAVPLARAKSYAAVSADLGGFRSEAGEAMITDVHKITSKAKEVK